MKDAPNQQTRRTALAMMLSTFGASACASMPARGARPGVFFIGTQGTQIFAARFDVANENLSLIGPVADVERPTWIMRHPTFPVLYAVKSIGNDGHGEAMVFSYAINAKTGALTKLSGVSSGGAGSNYLSIDAVSKTLFCANFGSGSVSSLPILVNGALGERTSVQQEQGSGPKPRQTGPHAHCIELAPSGRDVLVADLGADRLFVYPFDRATRTISPFDPSSTRHITLPAGSGPRHLKVHPSGRFVYLFTELSAELYAFRWEGDPGRLSQIQTFHVDPPGFSGVPSGAELIHSSDGRFLYLTNRGDHTIVTYAIDATSGMLKEIQRIGSGGERPWHVIVDPSERYMFVTNQQTNTVNVFRLDTKTGLLTATSKSLSVLTPVSVAFA